MQLLLGAAMITGGNANSTLNPYLWPQPQAENREAVKELRDSAPGVVADLGEPVGGSFIVVLTDVSTACEPSSPGCLQPYEVSQKRISAISRQLERLQTSVGNETFCGEVTGELSYLNMMTANLSPKCAIWVAQLRDVAGLEPDSTISTYDSGFEGDAEVDDFGFSVGVGAVETSNKDTPGYDSSTGVEVGILHESNRNEKSHDHGDVPSIQVAKDEQNTGAPALVGSPGGPRRLRGAQDKS